MYWTQMRRRTTRWNYKTLSTGIVKRRMQGAGRGGLSVSQAESIEPGANNQGGAFGPLTPRSEQAAPVTWNRFTHADEVPSQFEHVTTKDDGNPDKVTDWRARGRVGEGEKAAGCSEVGKASSWAAGADSSSAHRQYCTGARNSGKEKGAVICFWGKWSWRTGSWRTVSPSVSPHITRILGSRTGIPRSRSPTPGSSTVGPATSDSGSGSTFSLASKVRRRGKHILPAPFGIQHEQRCEAREQSHIKDKTMDTVVNKQKYPHAALQEFLWGWNGENIDYGKLSVGLFVAGEIEIITGCSMNDNDGQRRLQMLKTTAHRAQYVDWFKVTPFACSKVESGLATWDTNLKQVERMVLENPGKLDWSARLGMRQPKSGKKSTGIDRPGNTRAVSRGMTKTLRGTAGTSSPAHVSKLHRTTKTSGGGR